MSAMTAMTAMTATISMSRIRGTRAAALAIAMLLMSVAGCAVVPQNRRKHLADPMMSFEVDPLETHKRQKFYSTREAAAGGDGVPAGGGCGCQ